MLTASIAKLLVYAQAQQPMAFVRFMLCRVCQPTPSHSAHINRLFLGYVWPAYSCFKALKGKKQDAARFWCHYWSVCWQAQCRNAHTACFTQAHTGTLYHGRTRPGRARLLVRLVPPTPTSPPINHHLHRIPLYQEAKVLFVLFLWHPSTQGSEYLYDVMVEPLLSAQEPRIDAALADSQAWFKTNITANVDGYARVEAV